MDNDNDDVPDSVDDYEDDYDDEETFEIEQIIGKRIHDGRVEYFVKWHGYGMEDCTWHASEDLDCFHLIQQFENIKQISDGG